MSFIEYFSNNQGISNIRAQECKLSRRYMGLRNLGKVCQLYQHILSLVYTEQLNQFLREAGSPTFNLMNNPYFFKPLVVLELIWKETGWGTIIILAALLRIDTALYEAAAIDGADGWRRLAHVTLPGIRGVIVLLLILRLATTLNTGFEQIFLQRNAVGPGAAEVLDTLTYFRGIQGGDWGFSAAVGLVKGIFAAVLVFAANGVAKSLGDEGAFG